MYPLLKIRWKKLVSLIALPILTACSGPGMQFNAYASGSKDAPDGKAPEVKVITPELVKAEIKTRARQSSDDITRLIAPAKRYTIEKGDILSIVVWDHPELTGAPAALPAADVGPSVTPAAGFAVDHDGMVQFPYIGSVKVAGLTEEQARNLIASKLAYYIKKPKVTLRVQSYRSKRVYVDGEVKNPGLQAIDDIPMSLMEALNRAGGMLPTSDQSQILLTRGDKSYRINLPELVQKGVNPGTIMLASGDVVRVPSREDSKVFVSGEVISPRSLTMRNGRLTLNEALGEAGGVSPVSGDASQIYVIRRSGEEPVVYRLDANAPGALAMAEGFELHPKDVVYVAATPLMNWHRTISALFPGALSSAVSAGSTAAKP